MKDLLNSLSNVCLSGGAEGADLQWGMCAGKLGHNVIHWSFAGHRSNAPDVELVRLDDVQLSLADATIKIAAKTLLKHPPKNKWVLNLIQRNYYQIAWSNSVYVISSIQNNIVQGGSGWAVYMYLALHPNDSNCYVFCQLADAWYKNDNGTFVQIDSPPPPTGIWAGIGSRDLTPHGKLAIRKLMTYMKPE